MRKGAKLSPEPAEAPDPEIDRLSPGDFRRLAKFINAYSGIKMPESKRLMLEGRLRRRLRATGFSRFVDYCEHLFNGEGMETEAIFLIDAVTTNKTDFFREPNHFDALTATILPEFVRRGANSLRIWSAACSIGAEPYTIAMVCADFAESHGPLKTFILATDLSTDVLRAARHGVYPADMLAPVPQALRRRYTKTSARDRSQVRVVPELRAHIGFARLNLMDELYPVGDPMHIIFCRNVLIYFDKATQRQVLDRLCRRLEPGGYLFLGHSESVTGFDLPIRSIGGTIFQKT
ncbi:chemotaxis protein CheR [Rhodoblastus acidophilus]|uniref:Chemotaxis protein methyltransferase n=1 Tax=Rhodoblastus acidophilus TaxID=1074 RepID=A0A6N8DU81_RHOAC|nr:CheR family methyltransferase [Rhodoblastus acidophilus]MCW2275799.1 chemotaxis protein methyltransferase CheR [Rhodoblastus acidophilus]MTV32404.1 chemotaxis protein CheR [Rhodoblastus acidophilus]